MDTIAVTRNVVAYGSTSEVFFPPLPKWKLMRTEEARAKGADRIAPLDFEERIQRFREGHNTDLTYREGFLRVGCSMGLLVNRQLVFGQFDMSHPTRPGCLTPAAGAFEGDCTLLEAASRELAEEFIIDEIDRVGFWRTPDRCTYDYQAIAYAKDHNLQTDRRFVVPVKLIEDFPGAITILMGGVNYRCLVEFEPDTSSIELIFVAKADLPDGVKIVDGERLPDGSWRNTPVVRWSPDCNIPLTTKAEVLIKTFGRS